MDFVLLVKVLVELERNLVRHLVETCHANSLQVFFAKFLSVNCKKRLLCYSVYCDCDERA